ncbi:MAG: hypothetical protein Q9217_004412 [Psora testacea]
MSGAPSIIRGPPSEKSNVELVNSLQSNFLASKQAFAPAMNGDTPSHAIHKNNLRTISYTEWTKCQNDFIFIPSVDFTQTGLAEERSQYDITVKLFFLPNTFAYERHKHAQEAINLVLQELHMPSIDLLIVSFPGVSIDADGECEDPVTGDVPNGESEDIDAMTTSWRAVEELHEKGIALQVGLSEFGSDRLQKFLPKTKVRPSVDQISLKDCCVVPKSLAAYAKQESIELLTHNDCTNILPSGTVRELLGTGEKGAGVLIGPDSQGEGLKGDIKPQWVIKYTAVVRDRGVIENKGYFAMAQIQD